MKNLFLELYACTCIYNLQGSGMFPTTLTTEMTRLKEKVRTLEVRQLVMFIMYMHGVCSLF